MISIAYDLRCETIRFAKRNIRFVYPAFCLLEAGSEMAVEMAFLRTRALR
jgi:hypothetical protein